MTLPTYIVECALKRRVAGLFQIGISVLGGTDLIGADFGTGDYDDITDQVKEIAFSRGRSRDFAMMEAGTCRITLRDLDGRWNVENASSPIYADLDVMRPVRIRATYSATTYGLYYGFIRNIEHNPDRTVQESVIECIDLFTWLAGSKAVIATKTNYTVSQLIDVILTAAKWAGTSWRNLSTGGSVIPSFSTDGSKSLLQYIADLLAVDLGYFFIAGDGRATYKTRYERYGYVAPTTTLDGTMLGALRPSKRIDGIINGQTVTRTGGTAQTVTNETSRNNYGSWDGSPISTAYLATDGAASSLAELIVAVSCKPLVPARKVRLLNSDATNLTQILDLELGDIVTATEARTGTSITGPIEHMDHKIDGQRGLHEATYTIRKKTVTMFTIGSSVIGGTDIIGY